MDKEEMQNNTEELKNEISEPDLKDSDKEIELANEDSEWFDLLNNGDIRKRSLNSVEEGAPRPERGSRCDIKLVTKNQATGEVIKSETYDRLTVFVGEYDVIHGVDLALPLLHLGEIAQVLIKPRFGYGTKGKSPDVPENCELDCEVTLLDIKWAEQLQDEDEHVMLNLANAKKTKGNFWYAREDYSSATVSWKKALDILDTLEAKCSENSNQDLSLIDSAVDLRFALHNNLCIVLIKSQSYAKALESVNSALEIKPDNTKALYRKGCVLKERGETEEAISVLNKALSFQANNKEILDLLSQLKERKKKETESERILYKRMFKHKQMEKQSQPSSNSSPSEIIENNEKSNHQQKDGNDFISERRLQLIMGSSFLVAAILSILAFYIFF